MAKGQIGHNSIAADELRSIIERVEKLKEEKQAVQGDISDVFTEAKGKGYDVKTIREIIKLREKSASERDEQQSILETYMHALGMLPETEDEDE